MVSAKNFAYFNRQKDKYAKAEEVLIYLCSSNLEIKEQIKQLLSPDIFIDEIVKSLYRNILDIDLINKDLVDSLGLEEEKAYLSSVLISGAEKHYGTDGFTDYVNLLKEYQEKQKVDAISYKLKELDNQPGQEAEVLKLLQELNSLKKS
jgi:hypothetical protein